MNFDVIKRYAKPFAGYSDLSAVLNAIYSKTGIKVILYQIMNLILDKTEAQYRNFSDGNFGLNDVSMGTPYTWKSGKSREGLVSFFGRVSYNFNERYLVTGTLRADGSSKFAKGNQWGYFPSASAAWRISEEAFMEDVEFIDNLKLRVGYGTSGNNNIDTNMYATDYGSGHYGYNGTDFITLVPGTKLGNKDLKWEKTTSTNIICIHWY